MSYSDRKSEVSEVNHYDVVYPQGFTQTSDPRSITPVPDESPPTQVYFPVIYTPNNPSAYPPSSYPPLQVVPVNPMLQPYELAPLPQAQIVAIVDPTFSIRPCVVFCTNCRTNVQTRTEKQPGAMVWFMVLILYFVCPFISCVPFCITAWYDVVHRCPNCSLKLGDYTIM